MDNLLQEKKETMKKKIWLQERWVLVQGHSEAPGWYPSKQIREQAVLIRVVRQNAWERGLQGEKREQQISM